MLSGPARCARSGAPGALPLPPPRGPCAACGWLPRGAELGMMRGAMPMPITTPAQLCAGAARWSSAPNGLPASHAGMALLAGAPCRRRSALHSWRRRLHNITCCVANLRAPEHMHQCPAACMCGASCSRAGRRQRQRADWPEGLASGSAPGPCACGGLCGFLGALAAGWRDMHLLECPCGLCLGRDLQRS